MELRLAPEGKGGVVHYTGLAGRSNVERFLHDQRHSGVFLVSLTLLMSVIMFAYVFVAADAEGASETFELDFFS